MTKKSKKSSAAVALGKLRWRGVSKEQHAVIARKGAIITNAKKTAAKIQRRRLDAEVAEAFLAAEALPAREGKE